MSVVRILGKINHSITHHTVCLYSYIEISYLDITTRHRYIHIANRYGANGIEYMKTIAALDVKNKIKLC